MPAFGLGGGIPVEVARSKARYAAVITLLKRIDYGVLT